MKNLKKNNKIQSEKILDKKLKNIKILTTLRLFFCWSYKNNFLNQCF